MTADSVDYDAAIHALANHEHADSANRSDGFSACCIDAVLDVVCPVPAPSEPAEPEQCDGTGLVALYGGEFTSHAPGSCPACTPCATCGKVGGGGRVWKHVGGKKFTITYESAPCPSCGEGTT